MEYRHPWCHHLQKPTVNLVGNDTSLRSTRIESANSPQQVPLGVDCDHLCSLPVTESQSWLIIVVLLPKLPKMVPYIWLGRTATTQHRLSHQHNSLMRDHFQQIWKPCLKSYLIKRSTTFLVHFCTGTIRYTRISAMVTKIRLHLAPTT